jgi:RNase P/RNase MRP subunit POP5
LTLSVAVAFDRTNTLPRNIEQMVKDVSSEFKNVDIEHVQKAIRRGSLGFYGKTFGEVSTQEICIWIIKYIEENPRAEPMEQRLKRLNKGV